MQLAEMWGVVRWNGDLHQQQRPVGVHRPTHVSEDLQRLGLGPVVDDVLEHVRVAARGHRVEEGTGLDGAAVQDARGFEYRLSAGDNGFQVVLHTAGVRRVLQDGAEKQTVAATDIDDRPEAGEVVCREDQRVLQVETAVIPSLISCATSGLRPAYSNRDMPWSLSTAGLPVSTE